MAIVMRVLSWQQPTALIGRAVYGPFKAQKPGIIIAYTGMKPLRYRNSDSPCFSVKWLDGTETEEAIESLNDFDVLIEDHRRALTNHESRLQQLRAMVNQ